MLRLFILVLLMVNCLFVPEVLAQSEEELQEQISELQARLRELEDYVATLQPNLVKFSEQLQNNVTSFKTDVDNSLQQFSKDVQMNIDERIRSLDDNAVALDVVSKGYQTISTRSGSFLISVKKVDRLEGGYRLFINVGNPNFAAYRGINFKLFWGKKWDPNSQVAYGDWRKTLIGATYSYDGRLEPGVWTEVAIDVQAPSMQQLGYVECSMELDAVEMNRKMPKK